MRHERGEGIVGDLGPGTREARDQRALACVGETHHPDVGEQAQLQPDAFLFALCSRLREARRLERGSGEVHVAEAAPPAFGEDVADAIVAKVGDHLARGSVLHQGAGWNLEEKLLRGVAVLIAPAAGLAVARLVFALEAEVEQRGEPAVRFQDHVAAISAVSAGRAAARSVLLPPEGDGTAAAVARFDVDLCFVDELHGESSRLETLEPVQACAVCDFPAGTTCT